MTGGQAVVSATDQTLPYDLLRDFDFIAIVTRFPVRLRGRARFALQDDGGLSRRGAPASRASSPTAPRAWARPCTWRWSCCCRRLGLKMTHVPYKGGLGAPYNDLVGGRLDMHDRRPSPTPSRCSQTAKSPGAGRHLEGAPSRLSRTCRRSRRRSSPDYDVVSWLGFTAPAGLPPAMTRSLARGLRAGDGAAGREATSSRSWATTRGSAHRPSSGRASRPT